MPARSVLAVASLAALIAGAASVSARAEGPLDAFLPKSGKIEGHVMSFDVAPEDAAIDRQFRNAVANNMDWFKKYVTSNTPGQPLPYTPKMGITKAQYDQLQHMRADFRSGDAVTIDLKREADGSLGFTSAAPQAAELTKVHFPAGEKEADTPYGKLTILSEIHQKDTRAPIGVWDGEEWAKVGPTDESAPSVKIAFGKREPSGEGVMYYQVSPYKDHKEQSFVVFYKLD